MKQTSSHQSANKMMIMCVGCLVLFGSRVAWAQEDQPADPHLPVGIPASVQSVIDIYCVTCHGPEQQEGDIRLDNLGTLSGGARSDLLNAMHQAIRFEEMPPEDHRQPAPAERKRVDDWISGALSQQGPSKLDEKLQRPEYGNYVDHDKLFSGKYAAVKGFTYDRRWLISQFIFDAKFNRILNHRPNQNIDGKRHSVIGSNNRRVNLTNPFLLPTNSGVRYNANETLNGGHLLTMLTNAKEASDYMSGYSFMLSGGKQIQHPTLFHWRR